MLGTWQNDVFEDPTQASFCRHVREALFLFGTRSRVLTRRGDLDTGLITLHWRTICATGTKHYRLLCIAIRDHLIRRRRRFRRRGSCTGFFARSAVLDAMVPSPPPSVRAANVTPARGVIICSAFGDRPQKSRTYGPVAKEACIAPVCAVINWQHRDVGERFTGSGRDQLQYIRRSPTKIPLVRTCSKEACIAPVCAVIFLEVSGRWICARLGLLEEVASGEKTRAV